MLHFFHTDCQSQPYQNYLPGKINFLFYVSEAADTLKIDRFQVDSAYVMSTLRAQFFVSLLFIEYGTTSLTYMSHVDCVYFTSIPSLFPASPTKSYDQFIMKCY